ncbi:acyclic terpene utilization AtuA family protein [Herbaspirillum rubrisubalbicans]|uniref:acyclic terpene utilization AtuA family protein n=1 Tax=Herbaspirillum rubrisubalbicans TaxID=80842 RepID=UPI001559F133|nr:acyclic terpene utilization AtuA family protein [Herbaspirillum rubrisubalbicans]NQE51081.1 ABC transporter substrate-binding protein [Herbaspirillum rubrisubalbicans]
MSHDQQPSVRTIRIGAGAGYSGDRIEPAAELAEKGQLDYLIFECLAERTIAIGQQARLADPSKGYDPLLAERMHAVLKTCARQGVRIITNMGAANPLAAARRIREIARELGLAGLKVAAVVGDDVLQAVQEGDFRIEDNGQPVASLGDRLISANAYLGSAPIVEALQAGAQVIVTGRVADPALVLAPLVHEFGWAMDDWDKLGQGTLIGHLLECAGQITGGYFADPGKKDVAALARLGFPIGEVRADGSAVITKVAGSGGQVTAQTCKEQLLYEIHDPSAYLTPDVIADFSQVQITELGTDRVAVTGARGRARPATLKTTLGYRDSFIGEGQMSYAGPGAQARAQLAADIVRERLALTGVETQELRFDLIGVNAIGGPAKPAAAPEPDEVRLRVAGRTASMKQALRIGNEVETLYTNGPAGGGGATKSAREVIAVLSLLLPRTLVHTSVHIEEA